MVLFNNNSEKQSNSSPRRPTESVQLTESLVAGIWTAEDDNGQVRHNWNLSRMSADGTRTYKTMNVASVLELPMFVARLSEGFASSDAVPADLREKLAQQAVDLGEYCSRPSPADSERKVNGKATSNLVFAA